MNAPKLCVCRCVLMAAVFAVFFASCTSSGSVKTAGSQIETKPAEPRIAHPYEYFDFDKDLYLTFPVTGNEELFTAVVQKVAPGMSKFSVKQLVEKTKFFYLDANLDFLFDAEIAPTFQFCATGSFPTSYRSMLFTNGNGFRQVKEEQKDRIYEYFYNRDGKFFIDIPQTGYCFADTDYLSGMLLAQEQTQKGEVYKPEWKEEIVDLMFSSDESTKIDWYIAKAEPLVTMLLGGSARLPLQYAFGQMEKIENSANTDTNSLLYKINATLETTDKRFVRPNVAVLNRFIQQAQPAAAGIVPNVSAGSDCEILISDWVIDLGSFISKVGVKNEQ